MARKNVEIITLNVPIGTREQINAHAESLNYPTTNEYIRHLIEADMQAHGKEIDLAVDLGGDRRPTKRITWQEFEESKSVKEIMQRAKPNHDNQGE